VERRGAVAGAEGASTDNLIAAALALVCPVIPPSGLRSLPPSPLSFSSALSSMASLYDFYIATHTV
jgi:hypothetical protein